MIDMKYINFYTFFDGMFMRVSMNNLDGATNSTFNVGGNSTD